MDFNEYQDKCSQTAVYPNRLNNYIYPTLGLNGEAGEVAEKIKKIIRDKNGIINDDSREEIKKEIGDVLWYVAALCDELKLSMEDVAISNIKKLTNRLKRNKVKGEGDNR